MTDAQGRAIDYMRVSITDRCNLRCKYCMPDGLPLTTHDKILRYEEFLRVCALMAQVGIHTFKVTGGEPLARLGCVDFIKKLKALPGTRDVTLTTNGVLLEPVVDELAQAGLSGVNISLDTLRADTFRRITGYDEFSAVWRAIEKAVAAGLKVKINTVPMQGLNDMEILEIARLAEKMPVDVRFIELMPTRAGKAFGRIPGNVLLGLLQKEYPDFAPDNTRHGFGPARYYKSGRTQGSIGFISAVSNHFCGACNRVRLTSEGYLKLCLYRENGVDLKSMLRGHKTDGEMLEAIQAAILQKPEKHGFGEDSDTDGIKSMSRIGG